MSKLSRRQFLGTGLGSASLYALASAGLVTTRGLFSRAYAAPDTSGYKALVCVNLLGGNSSAGMIIPIDSYANYATARGGLAQTQASLLPLNGMASDGKYGVHAKFGAFQTIFNSGKAAVICNVGTLISPLTKTQAKSGTAALPPQLFSHSDQQAQWATSIANGQDPYGWAGRVADFYTSSGDAPKISMNYTVAGTAQLQRGRATSAFALASNGSSPTATFGDRNGALQAAFNGLITQGSTDSNLMVQTYSSTQSSSSTKTALINAALTSAGDVTTVFTPTPADHSEGDIASQLHQVARIMKAQSQIGDARQIFFVNMQGYDTHNGELAAQNNLFNDLGAALTSFWAALGELKLQNNVTVFSNSEFGRTLSSNGDGADHAWGGHSFVFGGAVKGGYYGTMPTLQLQGPDDFGDNGLIIPTTSTDQYAATLCKWYGIADSDLDSLFPNLKNFKQRDLGFLSA